MSVIRPFIPTLFFICLYLGGMVYAMKNGAQSDLLATIPIIAVLAALILAWIIHKGKDSDKTADLISGACHADIVTMCLLFLLASVFAEITNYVGCTHNMVNLLVDVIPTKFLLAGLFLTSAFISTAIGTSMGTINTIGPIAHALALQCQMPVTLTIATVVGGAMFGDNLSVISDTTIAAVASQEADLKAKLKLNTKIALIAAFVTLLVLCCCYSAKDADTVDYPFSIIHTIPYLLVIVPAIMGRNVFATLIVASVSAILIGVYCHDFTLSDLARCVVTALNSVHIIVFFSLLVGGLSGLSGLYGSGSERIADKISGIISGKMGMRSVQFMIAKIVTVFDLLLANNTIAIIVSGSIAKNLSRRFNLPAHYSAVWLDIFSCVVQGIIPYGAQIMLASAITKSSPLEIAGNVYYCYILGITSIIHIIIHKVPRKQSAVV